MGVFPQKIHFSLNLVLLKRSHCTHHFPFLTPYDLTHQSLSNNHNPLILLKEGHFGLFPFHSYINPKPIHLPISFPFHPKRELLELFFFLPHLACASRGDNPRIQAHYFFLFISSFQRPNFGKFLVTPSTLVSFLCLFQALKLTSLFSFLPLRALGVVENLWLGGGLTWSELGVLGLPSFPIVLLIPTKESRFVMCSLHACGFS